MISPAAVPVMTAGVGATMILGRPVLPPEVGAFQAGDTTSGTGPAR
ncbi:Uncharacterised protein [Mycobacteroides abscessus subsp. abscessus]|nr:Uncharacterised protein [Mycobacteroides abscessus subsp. abscessus]